ncbi:MAG: GDP-L-fucose synthase [Bacteroidota bacterium]
MHKDAAIYIAGHNGMVGSAILRLLEERGYTNLVWRSSKELDLKDQSRVFEFFKSTRPSVVIDAAARVGGILANNSYPYQFLMDNLQIQNNLIEASIENDIEKFIFLGSSCIYPKKAEQPLKEDALLTSSLEPTNQWYAIAKIAGVKACEAVRVQYGKDYVSLMPTNLYGPRDNFDLLTSHVLPAMIRKFHDAKENGHADVTLWGSGTPMREFLFVEDLALAVEFALNNKLPDNLYNIGTGQDITIKDLAILIQNVVGHKGNIVWDASKPDGTPRKLMDVSKISELGWRHQVSLSDGIVGTYEWFLKHQDSFKTLKINDR